MEGQSDFDTAYVVVVVDRYTTPLQVGSRRWSTS